jgi:4a-hydroxytetrahydrobiopterin dehydratase
LGIELVTRAATSAEAANHHPDIDVRWRSVTFRLTTHDAGGVTMRDVHLARRIQGHATSLGWVSPPP